MLDPDEQARDVIERRERIVRALGAEARPRRRLAKTRQSVPVARREDDDASLDELAARGPDRPRELEPRRAGLGLADPHSARPSANSRPKTTSRRAVCTRQPLSARPRSWRMRPARPDGQRQRQPREQRPRIREAAPPQDRGHDVGRRKQCQVIAARGTITEAHRERELAGARVGLDVPQVVHHENRRRKCADRHRRQDHQRRHVLRLHEVRARHGAEAEEQEHAQVAEPEVAVGLRSAGVEIRRRDGQQAEREHRPAGHGREVETHDRRACECDPHGALHLRGADPALLCRALRSEPVLVVGAALEIEDVVREIGPDLQQGRADQGCDGGPGREHAVGPCGADADEHRGRRRRERRRPDRKPPRRACAYGRHGNREKSGGRFSL